MPTADPTPLPVTVASSASDAAMTVRGLPVAAVDADPAATFLDAVNFDGAVGAHTVVAGADGPEIVIGLGGDDRSLDDARRIGGVIARAAASFASVDVIDVLDAGWGDAKPAAVARALAEGLQLGAYRYVDQKSASNDLELDRVTLVGRGGKAAREGAGVGSAVGTAVAVARDLVNEPGGSLVPTAFADRAVALGKQFGFAVNVLTMKHIRDAGMGGLLGVNRGSELPARFVELTWTPTKKSKGSLALVGKGVTFDSGGLSLKPTDGMLSMKGDMGGAAAVLGAFCALGAVDPAVEVRGYLPLTDNMTGGDATRLGDVLRISDGTTVEVHNTDAEGRLILADALVRASADEPDAIVDLATLTGACMVALGSDYAGIFTDHDGWGEQVQAAASSAGELLWPLPLPEAYRSQLDSSVADIKNIGKRYGGASTAALFLHTFVGDGIPWVHLDIAGPAFADDETPLTRKGGTGFGVSTLVELARTFRRPS